MTDTQLLRTILEEFDSRINEKNTRFHDRRMIKMIEELVQDLTYHANYLRRGLDRKSE